MLGGKLHSFFFSGLLVCVVACGGERASPAETAINRDPTTAADGGEVDTGVLVTPSVGPDAATAPAQSDAQVSLDATAAVPPVVVDAAPPPPSCLTPDAGIACSDGVFCNGVELCSPSDPRADTRGCVAGNVVVCAAGQMCSEQRDMCSTCSDSELDDDDKDGHEAASCGGDDCNDDDATVHPGLADSCDGKDNDCDGAVDGTAANLACGALAPTGAASTCVAGSCAVRCTDADFDLVAGACVRHDDCAGVTACGVGTCADGSRTYTCTCPAGYAGSGTTACTDIDECATPSAHTCDTSPLACINQPGSFRCACPATHFGNGTGAQGCARRAVSVAAGTRSTCVVLSEGRVKCWGNDSFGKLGLGGSTESPRGGAAAQMGDALPYVNLGAGRSARTIAAGSDVTCGVLDNGAVKCWGYNGYGAVGGSDLNSFGITPTVAPLPPGRTAVAVGAGSGNGFAVLDDGTFGHWGTAFTPYVVPAGERVRSFDRSPRYDSYHLCALFEAGSVRCWSAGQPSQDMGQYGWAYSPSLPPASYPAVSLGAGRTAVALALGDVHSCALLDNGAVKCWGANDRGQLGLGDVFARGGAAADMGDALPAVALGGTARAIAAGASHTCALLTTGAVKCWGFNDAGQLGQGNTNTIGDQPGELEALPAIDLGPGRTATAIDVGLHSCAVLDTGAVKCWGINTSGELGQGDLLTRGATSGTMGAALPEIVLGE